VDIIKKRLFEYYTYATQQEFQVYTRHRLGIPIFTGREKCKKGCGMNVDDLGSLYHV